MFGTSDDVQQLKKNGVAGEFDWTRLNSPVCIKIFACVVKERLERHSILSDYIRNPADPLLQRRLVSGLQCCGNVCSIRCIQTPGWLGGVDDTKSTSFRSGRHPIRGLRWRPKMTCRQDVENLFWMDGMACLLDAGTKRPSQHFLVLCNPLAMRLASLWRCRLQHDLVIYQSQRRAVVK